MLQKKSAVKNSKWPIQSCSYELPHPIDILCCVLHFGDYILVVQVEQVKELKTRLSHFFDLSD